MSKSRRLRRHPIGAAAPSRAPEGEALTRLLESPALATIVPQLPAEALHRIIERHGLDVATDLIAAATPEQLASVLDLDLWRPPRAGADDVLDMSRFAEWLEALAAADAAGAAAIVASIDPELAIAGLSRHVRVFDLAALPPDDVSGFQIGGYHVRPCGPGSSEAAVSVLLTLSAHQPECFHRLMRGCRRLSNRGYELDGLDNLLPPAEQQLHTVATARETRRSDRGYVSAADARGFLEMARSHTQMTDTLGMSANPIVIGYLRACRDDERIDDGPSPFAPEGGPAAEVMADLAAAGLMPEQPRALLVGATAAASEPLLIQSLMASAEHRDPAACLQRGHELAFLANALAAGSSVMGRALTPEEAADAAVRVCNLGLELGRPAPPPDSWLVEHDLIGAFEAGWSALHRDVNLHAADLLLRALGDLDSIDPDIRRGLRVLKRTLRAQRRAGTPWNARDALDVLAMLDMPTWVSLIGVLDECPVVPVALTATLEGRVGAISATDFRFFSTPADVREVHAFLGRLPDLLSDL